MAVNYGKYKRTWTSLLFIFKSIFRIKRAMFREHKYGNCFEAPRLGKTLFK